MDTSINRSTFIKGTAMGVAALAVGAASTALADEPTFDYTADIVVVGSGCAGSMACVGAHKSGASSIMLEKAALFGGDSLLCHQDLLAFWPERTLADGGVEDTKESYLQDWEDSHEQSSLKGLRGEPRPESFPHMEKYVDIFPEVGQFLVEEAGCEFEPQFLGSSLAVKYSVEPRCWEVMGPTAVESIKAVLDTYEDFSAFNNTEALSLVQDASGRVIGVNAIGADGKPVSFGANKGVIIASGTFNSNPSMISKYLSPNWALLSSHGNINSTGDGHKMAQQVGAKFVDMDLGCNWFPSLLGDRDPYRIHDHLYIFGEGEGYQAKYDPAIVVNMHGKRFMKENLGYCGIARETADQDYMLSFYVNDSQIFDQELFDGPTNIIISGDTIEELALKMPFPTEDDRAAFIDEVARYNGFVEAGVDEDFGKMIEGCQPIATPPFYAYIVRPEHYVTYGGIATDTDSRVLDSDDNPIPGLYAAGIVCGSYAEEEGMVYLGGFGQALAWGMNAGKAAAAEL